MFVPESALFACYQSSDIKSFDTQFVRLTVLRYNITVWALGEASIPHILRVTLYPHKLRVHHVGMVIATRVPFIRV